MAKSGDIQLTATLSLVDNMTRELNKIEASVSKLMGTLNGGEGIEGLNDLEVNVDTSGAEAGLEGVAEAAEGMETSVEGAAEGAAAAAEGVGEAYEGAAETVGEAGESMESSINGAAEALSAAADDSALSIKDIEEQIEELSEKADKGAEGIERLAEEGIDGLTDSMDAAAPLAEAFNEGLEGLAGGGEVVADVIGNETGMALSGLIGTALLAGPALTTLGSALGSLAVELVTLAIEAINADDGISSLTAASKKQYYEIEDLTKEYDSLCSEGRGLSDEALRLKYQIEDLTAEFEANKKSIADVAAEGENLQSVFNDSIGMYDDTVSGVDDELASTLSLVKQLEDLSAATDGVSASGEKMEAVYDRLSGSVTVAGFDDFESVSADIEGYTAAVKKAAQAQADSTLKAGLYEDEIDYNQQIAEEENYVEALELLKIQAEESENAIYEKMAAGDINEYELAYGLSDIDEEISTYDGLIADSEERVAEYNAQLAVTEARIEALAAAHQEAIAGVEDLGSAEETAAAALEVATDVSGEALENLRATYKETYDAALESIQGQIGLFDEFSASSELSSAQMIANMNSQTEGLTNFAENLQKAGELGLDADLIAQMSDISYAGELQALIADLENGTISAEEFNAAFRDAQAAQAGAAAAMAMQDVDVSGDLEAAVTAAYEAIEAMDISDEAKSEAIAAANEYIAGLCEGMDVSEVEAVGDEILSTMEAAAEGAETSGDEAVASAEESAAGIENAYASLDLSVDGVNVIQGVIRGMESQRPALEAAATSLAGVIKTAFAGALEISSPSKVMFEYGEFAGEGAILGLENMLGAAETVSSDFAYAFETSELKPNLSDRDAGLLKSWGGGSAGGGDTYINIDMTGMVNEIKSDSDIDSVVDRLKRRLTEELYSTAAGVHA